MSKTVCSWGRNTSGHPLTLCIALLTGVVHFLQVPSRKSRLAHLSTQGVKPQVRQGVSNDGDDGVDEQQREGAGGNENMAILEPEPLPISSHSVVVAAQSSFATISKICYRVEQCRRR